jgi:hypothetical protein
MTAPSFGSPNQNPEKPSKNTGSPDSSWKTVSAGSRYANTYQKATYRDSISPRLLALHAGSRGFEFLIAHSSTIRKMIDDFRAVSQRASQERNRSR